MVQEKGNRRTLFTTISILVVLLIAIGVVGLFKILGQSNDPYKQEATSESSQNGSDTPQQAEDTPLNSNSSSSDGQAGIDPATVSTVDIAPMEITVSYVKGIGGFQYEVLRAANGTRYVEFRSTTLVGTKCTNDTGTFASIIANPTESESTDLAKTTTVDTVKYGLALADANCTSDNTKLQEYQKSFSDAFSLLKKIQ